MIYTKRSKKYFLSTNNFFQERIIEVMLSIKEIAAKANYALCNIQENVYLAILNACEELKMKKGIRIEVFQTGSGTGLNMILNELIAKKAGEIAKMKIHPNDHVNKGQSSNDVVPSAIRIAAFLEIREKIVPSMELFIQDLKILFEKYRHLIKPGRTHLRDALPVTLGLEILSYYYRFDSDLKNIKKISSELLRLPIGGGAVGTGSNVNDHFSNFVIKELGNYYGQKFLLLRDRGTGMKFITDIYSLSASLTAVSIDLNRLAQDLRLMFSGPFTGIGEIDFKNIDIEGSSIMPGKTNPVTIEAIMQANAQIFGLNFAILQASLLGEFELSMGIPLVGYDILEEIRLLNESIKKMDFVIKMINPNKKRMHDLAFKSPEILTALSSELGYDKVSEIIKEITGGKDQVEVLKKYGIDKEKINEILETSLKKFLNRHLKTRHN
ncbi:MAG: lyase family protein [Thermoplasmata archaeon]